MLDPHTQLTDEAKPGISSLLTEDHLGRLLYKGKVATGRDLMNYFMFQTKNFFRDGPICGGKEIINGHVYELRWDEKEKIASRYRDGLLHSLNCAAQSTSGDTSIPTESYYVYGVPVSHNEFANLRESNESYFFKIHKRDGFTFLTIDSDMEDTAGEPQSWSPLSVKEIIFEAVFGDLGTRRILYFESDFLNSFDCVHDNFWLQSATDPDCDGISEYEFRTNEESIKLMVGPTSLVISKRKRDADKCYDVKVYDVYDPVYDAVGGYGATDITDVAAAEVGKLESVLFGRTHIPEVKSLNTSFIEDLESKHRFEIKNKKIEKLVDELSKVPSHNYAFDESYFSPETRRELFDLHDLDLARQKIAEDVSWPSTDLTEAAEEAIGAINAKFELHKITPFLYGVSLPMEAMKQAFFDPETSAYYWMNEQRQLHGFNDELPGIIYPDGTLYFYNNGRFHRESGPAVVNIFDKASNSYWLHGVNISAEEFSKYDHFSRRIEFRDNFGLLHREQKPAVIEFTEEGPVSYFYTHGVKAFAIKNKKADSKMEAAQMSGTASNSRVAKVRKISMDLADSATNVSVAPVKYLELTAEEAASVERLFKKNISYLEKYAPEIHKTAAQIQAKREAAQKKEAAEKAKYESKSEENVEEVKKHMTDAIKEMMVKELKNQLEDSTVAVETKKIIRSAPDLSGSKVSQLKNGFVFGFKKQVIHNSSHLLAEKVIDLTPMKGNQWSERALQICFLLGLAEIIERMPEGMAERLKLTEDARLNFSSICRYISGESMGRDLVDIATNVLPHITEILKGVTTEELSEMADEFEKAQEEDEAALAEDSSAVEEAVQPAVFETLQQAPQYEEMSVGVQR